jgi:hypothetical protein
LAMIRIGVVSQAAPVELGFRLASLRRVYLCRN